MKHFNTKITNLSKSTLSRVRGIIIKENIFGKYDTTNEEEAIKLSIYELNQVSYKYWLAILRLIYDGEILQGPAISIFRVMMELHIDIGILLFSLEDGNINGSGIRFI